MGFFSFPAAPSSSSSSSSVLLGALYTGEVGGDLAEELLDPTLAPVLLYGEVGGSYSVSLSSDPSYDAWDRKVN